MKTTKFFFAIVAMVCTMTMTSCSSEDGPSYYYYVADGSLQAFSFSSSSSSSSTSTASSYSYLTILADYNTAINNVISSSGANATTTSGDIISGVVTQELDDAIIKACEEVYNTHQAATNTTITGTVDIKKYQGLNFSESDYTVIKTYTYE